MQKKKQTNTHCGRFLVAFHREEGMYTLEPLEDKDVIKGGAPPPESFDETMPLMDKTLRDGHIAATDGAQTFKKAAKVLKSRGVLSAYVVHKGKQFAKVVKIPVSYLSAKMKKRVATLPTTTSRFYRFKAGVNIAENTFSVVKRNLRRMNLMSSTANAKINFLSSAWLHKHPGLAGVAEGMKIYQEYAMINLSPQQAFKDAVWLTSLEQMV